MGTSIPKVKGILEIPGGKPFIGHLHYLAGKSGKSDAGVWTDWHRRFGQDIFQIKFGRERVIIVNKYESIKELWVGKSLQLVEKPEPFLMKKYIGRPFVFLRLKTLELSTHHIIHGRLGFWFDGLDGCLQTPERCCSQVHGQAELA